MDVNMTKQGIKNTNEQDVADFIVQGQPAKLFPTVSSPENRLLSIFLALLPYVPELATNLFSTIKTIGFKVGTRAKINCWTEVVPNSEKSQNKRPDGLIVVKSGKLMWSALIEAKIKDQLIDEEQVSSYLELAKDCGINAVITISNQFVTRPDQSPVKVKIPKNVTLIHWSWTYIRTSCEILSRDAIDDPQQAFLLNEFLRLLDHKDTGVRRFASMNQNWKKLVQTVTNQGSLDRKGQDVQECLSCWYQEERDLSLQLSRHVGANVQTVIAKGHLNDPEERLKFGVSRLVEEGVLSTSFRVPNCAADLEICAHLMARTLTYSMKLRARNDQRTRTTRARVMWLLKMLPSNETANRLVVRAHWPGQREPSDKTVGELREDGNSLDLADKPKTVPHRFEVLLIEHLKGDFFGNRKFIERLEKGMIDFYDLVGQNLRAWRPPPLKPVKKREVIDDSNGELAEIQKSNISDDVSE